MDDPPAPGRPPAGEGLLTELARMVRLTAASPDRDLAEIVAWLNYNGL
jgi:hypothetical protein